MNDIAVDKNIPIPKQLGTKWTKWPFSSMEIGDSFAVAEPDRHRLGAAVSYRHKHHPARYVVRKYADAYRCWRTE